MQLWTTSYALDETRCSQSPLSPPSHFLGLSSCAGCDDSGLSLLSSPLSPSDYSPTAQFFSESFTTSSRWFSSPYMLAHIGGGDDSAAASPAPPTLPTSITAAPFSHSSVPPPSAHKKSPRPVELIEKRAILPFVLKLWGMVRDSSSATHPSCRRDREDLLHLISKKRSVKRSSAAVDDHYSQSDGTVGNKVLISQLYAQARQLFVQHEQLTCSQSSILLRLQGMMRERDLNQQSSAGETVAASTSGGEAPALKRRKRNFDSSDGTF
jgi:hypothetical protein